MMIINNNIPLYMAIVCFMSGNALHASELSSLNQQLLHAVKSKTVHAITVHSLVEQRADVNVVDASGKSPLLYCLEDAHKKRGVASLVHYLLAANANVNACDSLTRMTALHTVAPFTALPTGEVLLELLLAHRADPNQRDFMEETPLFKQDVTPRAVQLLLAAKADVNVRNSAGISPLFVCKRSVVRRMLLEANADIAGCDYYGNTLLMRAASTCNDSDTMLRDEAALLLQRKADIDAVNKYGENAFLKALQSRNLATACLLMDCGAFCNLFNHYDPETVVRTMGKGDAWCNYVVHVLARSQVAAIIAKAFPRMQKRPATIVAEYCFGEARQAEHLYYPLYCALREKDSLGVRLLVSEGAPLNEPGLLGNTHLIHCMRRKDNDAIIHLLLALKADVLHVNRTGCTALHYAALEQRKNLVVELLARKANPNAVSNSGDTPFTLCGNEPSGAIARLLLDAQATIHTQNNEGKTLLHNVAQYGSPVVAEFLLQRNLDPNMCDNNGNTPLLLAGCQKKCETALCMMRLLLDHKANVHVQNKQGKRDKILFWNKVLSSFK